MLHLNDCGHDVSLRGPHGMSHGSCGSCNRRPAVGRCRPGTGNVRCVYSRPLSHYAPYPVGPATLNCRSHRPDIRSPKESRQRIDILREPASTSSAGREGILNTAPCGKSSLPRRVCARDRSATPPTVLYGPRRPRTDRSRLARSRSTRRAEPGGAAALPIRAWPRKPTAQTPERESLSGEETRDGFVPPCLSCSDREATPYGGGNRTDPHSGPATSVLRGGRHRPGGPREHPLRTWPPPDEPVADIPRGLQPDCCVVCGTPRTWGATGQARLTCSGSCRAERGYWPKE